MLGLNDADDGADDAGVGKKKEIKQKLGGLNSVKCLLDLMCLLCAVISKCEYIGDCSRV